MLETGLYAGILSLIYIALSINVVRMRFKTKIKLGDGGNLELLSAIRAHGNFAEYVPFALLLIAILNMQGMDHNWIHGLGFMLIAGRITHAYSISKDILKLRPIGMGLTFACIAIAGLLLMVRYVTVLPTVPA